MKNTKLINLRALAILLVVFGHSIILYYPGWGFYHTTNKVVILEKIKYIINIVQMPIFFSIAGYLFHKNITQKKSLKKFVFNKFKRLIIPMLIVGILYMIPIRCIINYPPYKNLNLLQILLLFIEGKELGHLWYLITLFLIFLISYLFKNIKKITLNNSLIEIITFIFLTIIAILQSKIYINTYINLVMENIIYFYTGILLNKYEKYITIKKHNCSILLITLLFFSLIFKNQYYNLLCSILSIILFYNLIPNKTNQAIEILSKNSFGVYLFHSPLVYITYSFFNNYNPLFVVTLNFFVFGLIAFFLTIMIRKSKFRFIIGE